jgi:hypothetical protein
MAPTSRTEIAVDVFLKRDDFTEEGNRKPHIGNIARFYGL